MQGEMLRDKVARGVAWSFGEKIGTVLLQMVVSIVVARQLLPEEMGAMALMTFFSSLALVVVDSGFSQMLIRRAQPSACDYKSVFLFNISISWVVYGVLVLLFPAVADFYQLPILAQIAPILFLLVPINAMGVIQNTLLVRQFRFALLSKITFLSSLLSGVLAVAMALSGYGVWSLVGQRLAAIAVRAALLWVVGNWHPWHVRASLQPLREMAPYSMRIMSADLIANIYNRVAQLFIGKIYSTDLLGYYYQAQKLEELPVTSTIQSVQSVTFPAFSQLADRPDKLARSFYQVIAVVAFLIFPLMLGLSAIAPNLFALLLGERWMPTVPYFEVMCLIGLFAPLTMVATNLLKTLSNGAIIVRLEVIKRLLMTVMLLVTIPCSVMAVTWGMVAMALVELLLNLFAVVRIGKLSLRSLSQSLFPTMLLSVAMYLIVCVVARGWLCAYPPWMQLLIQIVVGGCVYVVGALLLRIEALHEIESVCRKMLRRE
jgi:O-antigen/teichoic acid export membrane protein